LANRVAENMVLVSKKARHQQMHKPLSERDENKKKYYFTITYNDFVDSKPT
jgi:hypothetical protein